jgi:hypothetical protein
MVSAAKPIRAAVHLSLSVMTGDPEVGTGFGEQFTDEIATQPNAPTAFQNFRAQAEQLGAFVQTSYKFDLAARSRRCTECPCRLLALSGHDSDRL